MNKETKLGIFISLILGAFLVLLFYVGNFSLGKFYKFNVLFDNIDGLSKGAPVKMNGIEIGKVVDMELKENKVSLVIKIQDKIKILKNVNFRIASTGIVGTKFLEIYKGDDSFSSEYIKKGDIFLGDYTPSINDIVKKFSNIFDDLSGKGNFKDSDVSKILKNVREITEKFNLALGNDEKDVRDIIKNIKEFSAFLSNFSDKDKNNISQILESLKNASTKIDILMTTLNSNKGTIGTLVNDDETASKVKETINSIKDVGDDLKNLTNRVKDIEIFWYTDYNYNVGDDLGRLGAGIVIQTNPSKRYILKGYNFDFDTDDKYDRGDQRYNSITALIEKDFSKYFSFHVGLINSGGGMGARIKKGKFALETDVYSAKRFSKDYEKILWINTNLIYSPIRWASIKAGMSDILERQNFTLGMDINVKDEDISYLFGLIGLARL